MALWVVKIVDKSALIGKKNRKIGLFVLFMAENSLFYLTLKDFDY